MKKNTDKQKLVFLFIFKNIGKIFISVILFTVLAVYLVPAFSYALGDVFFGGVKSFYNVKLAQLFFKRASYPNIGQAFPYAHYQLSRTYFIQGRLETSLAEAKKEIEIFPEHVRTYYILGLTYGYMNRESEAIEAFRKFIEYKPGSWAARNDMAWLQFRVGDIGGALKTIEPVSGDTNNPWVQNTYGTLLLNDKRYEEAKQAFENAKKSADGLNAESWGQAYPGNDQRIYETGLRAMRASIENNLKLLKETGHI